MNRENAARLLRVSEDTLVRWVRQGLLRSVDRRGETFDREDLVRWAQTRGMQVDASLASEERDGEGALLGAIARGAIVTSAEAGSAAAAIRIALDALTALPDELRRPLEEAVLERERMASTALGRGIAVPHPREPLGKRLAQPFVSLVLLDVPVDWAAADGELVDTVALLASPTADEHLEILSEISRALHSTQIVRLLRERPAKSTLLDELRVLVGEVKP